MRKHVILYILLFGFLASFIGGSVFSTYKFFMQEGPLTERKEMLVPKGMPLQKIAQMLKEEGIIESPAIFTFGVRAHNKASALKAGEYSFPARSSAKMVMDILTDGQTHIRRLTVPEGLTSTQIVDLIEKAGGLVGAVARVPKNGTLLPETYYYSYGDTRESIIARMQNALTRTLDELWPNRADDLPFKNQKEAVTLASIVEKETSISAERSRIASVFLNRLEADMRLQSDPTVIYAVTNGTGQMKRALRLKDLRTKHAYNTYVIKGLPPAPIANPGRESIAAVLNPFKSKDMYFVADGTGGHVFAKTYDEHVENVKQWRSLKGDKVAQQQAKKQKKITIIPTVPKKPDIPSAPVSTETPTAAPQTQPVAALPVQP